MFVFALKDNSTREAAFPCDFSDMETMAELTVLLPEYQARALEEAAHRDGLTTGQFLRRLISRTISQQR